MKLAEIAAQIPSIREQAASQVYFPTGTEVIGVDKKLKACVVVLGRSGVGKSHLGRQLLLDPDYGKEEVLFLMAEDATQTYGVEGIHVRRIQTFMQAETVVEELTRATAAGKRLPKVIFVDSISGMADYTRQKVRREPPKVWSKEKGAEVDDVRGGFGDLGYSGLDLAIALRDKVDADVVLLVTTFEGAFNATPEIAVEGRLIPKNITRLSGSTFYMKAVPTYFDPTEDKNGKIIMPPAALHRSIATDADGNLYIDKGKGLVINRYLFTIDVGEVMAKGHHALNFQERAILPDVLRKIHGVEPREGGK